MGIVLIVVLVSMTFIIIKVKGEFDSMKGLDAQGIGKKINIVVDSNTTSDYRYFEGGTTILWKETERKKLIKHMKDNKLKVKPGEYIINQTTSFKESLKIFKLEKID